MNRYTALLFVLSFFFACKMEKEQPVNVSAIPMELQIERFEQLFYTSTAETLPALKNRYPYLFPIQDHDSIWLQRISDTTEVELFRRTERIFGTMERERKSLSNLFKHVTYYNPGFIPPKIITLISNRDYQSRAMYVDSLLFVSLDLYLGKDDDMYAEFPDYLAQQFEPELLPVAVANTLVEKQIPESRNRIFLNALISNGKKMELMTHYLPEMSDAQLLYYTPAELDWIISNEAEIWKYFIENNLLFSTDSSLKTRFIDDAPFSKFYLDIDKQSPGRIGIWMGWQIVRSFMENTYSSIPDLINTDPEELFKKSKYKPKK